MEAPRILVVDDDDTVRYTVCLVLNSLGCVTEPVSGAAEALARFQPGRYRAVVTDLVMPDMNGLELARRLRAAQPDLPILIFSGEHSLGEIEGTLIAPKPDIGGLTRLIRRILAQP